MAPKKTPRMSYAHNMDNTLRLTDRLVTKTVGKKIPRMAHVHEIKDTITEARKTARYFLLDNKDPEEEMTEAITKDVFDLVTNRDPIGKNRAETAAANMYHINDKLEPMENGADRKAVLEPLEMFVPEKKEEEETERGLRAGYREALKELDVAQTPEQKAIKLQEIKVARAMRDERRRLALEKKRESDKPVPKKPRLTTTGYQGTGRPNAKVTRQLASRPKPKPLPKSKAMPGASLHSPAVMSLSFRPKPKQT